MGAVVNLGGVEPAERPMRPLERDASLVGLLRTHCMEQHYESEAVLVACSAHHPFVQAAHDAFYRHYPLVLSPDAVWFCIAQGFAHHINGHAEDFRRRLVAHDGQLTLVNGMDPSRL